MPSKRTKLQRRHHRLFSYPHFVEHLALHVSERCCKMTWVTLLRASAVPFPSSFPPRRSASLLPPPAGPRRAQKSFKKLRLASSLGFGGGGRRGRDEEEEDAAAASELEDEIYEFMKRSGKPEAFPTREELIAAGRADLAEAIAVRGGWFALGWDLERGGEDSRICQQSPEDESPALGSTESRGLNSSPRRETETEEEEAGGIEGILSRLEKERRSVYAGGSVEQLNGKASWGDGEHYQGDSVGSIAGSSRPLSSDLDEEMPLNFGSNSSRNGISSNIGCTNMTPSWRTWSLQRAGYPAVEFEAGEIVSSEEGSVTQNAENDVLVDGNEVDLSENETGEQSTALSIEAEGDCQNQIRIRLKHLESELNSALCSLHSRSEGATEPMLHKDPDGSLRELHMLSDELEFKQTEIMNAKNKLRSTRAKLAVLQGKLTNTIIDARRITGLDKQRLDAARNALCLLRSTCIFWPNSASEVLLVGSFDGWASQRRMERSKSGIFTLYLMLYPGRYEIKFIVDGVWMIDPLRPIVCNNGYENNLLLVP